jgi:hypothetical protein
LTIKKKKVAHKKKGKAKMNWWEVLEAILKSSTRMMLVGPPGTGKSRTANDLLGKNAQRLTMTEGTGVEDLLGMFHLKKGETVWVDGPAARALRNGWPLVLDEIDKYSPEVGSLLYALLDDAPQVMLPTGEHLKAEPGYKVIATSNANVSSLPEPILDRMEAIILAIKPHPAAMRDMHPAEIATVENHYKNLNVKTWNWSGTATLRRMRAFSRFRLELIAFLNELIIAEAVFGSAGKEMVSVMSTAARSNKPESLQWIGDAAGKNCKYCENPITTLQQVFPALGGYAHIKCIQGYPNHSLTTTAAYKQWLEAGTY